MLGTNVGMAHVITAAVVLDFCNVGFYVMQPQNAPAGFLNARYFAIFLVLLLFNVPFIFASRIREKREQDQFEVHHETANDYMGMLLPTIVPEMLSIGTKLKAGGSGQIFKGLYSVRAVV